MKEKRPVNLGTAKSVPGKKGKHQEWRGKKDERTRAQKILKSFDSFCKRKLGE